MLVSDAGVKVEEGFVDAMRLHVAFCVDLVGGGGVS